MSKAKKKPLPKGVKTRTARDGTITVSVWFQATVDGKPTKPKERAAVLPAKHTVGQWNKAIDAAEALRMRRMNEVLTGEYAAKREQAEKTRIQSIGFGTAVDDFTSTRTTYYKDRAKAWKKHISAKKPLSGITRKTIEQFMKKREADGASSSTRRKDLISLRTFFGWAIDEEMIERNPCDRVKLPRRTQHDVEVLTDAEFGRYIDACGEQAWLQRLLRFAINTGAGRKETLELTWSQIDRRKKIASIPRGKTGNRRPFPYGENAELVAVLAECHKLRSLKTDRVFVDDDGKPLDVQRVKTACRRAFAHAKLASNGKKRTGDDKGGPWKILRSTFMTRMYEAGVDVRDAAALMGHSTLAMADRYQSIGTDRLAAAMGQLSQRVVSQG